MRKKLKAISKNGFVIRDIDFIKSKKTAFTQRLGEKLNLSVIFFRNYNMLNTPLKRWFVKHALFVD